MADYKIELGVQLDVSDINTQINNASSQIKPLKLKVDTDKIKNQINGIKFNKIKIEFNKNTLNSEIAKVRKQIQSLSKIKINLNLNTSNGNNVGGNINNNVKQLTTAYNKLRNISRNIGSIKIKLDGLDTSKDIHQIEILENQLKSLTAEYHKTVSKIKSKGDLSSSQWQTIQQQIDNTKLKLDQLSGELTDAKNKLASGIQLKLSDGTFANSVAKINSDFKKLSNQSDNVRLKIDEVEKALKDMSTASANGDINELINANKRYERALKDVENQLKINKRAEQDAINLSKLEQNRTNLSLTMDNWLKENSASAKQFGSRIRELQAELKSCNSVRLDGIRAEFSKIKKEAQLAGKTTQTFSDRLKTQFSKYSQYLSVASVFMYTTQALRDMFEQVKLIDSAMTELKKVTDETNESYNEFLSNSAERAKEIGTTIDGLVSSTADFARLGYGFQDAQGLAEVANIYAVVGDEVEGVEGATQSLISTMAAFKDEMNGLSNTDFSMEIIDKMNEVGNNFAISSGGIGEALQRSASSMSAANNTLDETIALITAANTVVQNPEKVGNGFKTIAMRIRGAKTELEEMGEDTSGMVESTATLRAEIEALSGVDIMLDQNTFKSTYQIMEELSQKWEGLSDIAQASITEMLAGKHQGNLMSSLMANFDVAQNALKTSLNSSGSAMKEHEKWSQSLEAKLLKLKATWQSLAQSFLSSDFLKTLLDGVIALVNGLDKLIDTFGAVPTLLGVFAGGRSLFNNKGIFTFDKELQQIQLLKNSLSDLSHAFNIGKGGQGGFSGFLSGLKSMRNAMSKSITKTDISNIQSYNNAIDNCITPQIAFNRHMLNSSKSAQKLVASANGGKVAMAGLTASTTGATVATIGLEVATIALNAALTMGISFLISAGISAITKWINASEELAEKVDEITSKFKEQQSELVKNQSSFESQAKRYGELSKGVNSLGENVSLTASEYEEYNSIVDGIANQVPSLVQGFNSQGTAILSCAGNVDVLTEAYKNLIIEQNDAVTKYGKDIFKDFKNSIKDFENKDALGNVTSDIFSQAELIDKVLKSSNLKNTISELSGMELTKVANILEESGIERNYLGSGEKGGENTREYVERVLKEDANAVKKVLGDNYKDLQSYTEELGTFTEAHLSTKFLTDYSDMSDRMQNMINQIASNFDLSFYEQFDDINGLEKYLNNMLSTFDSLSTGDTETLETAFDLKTQFNGGDISYGEYIKGLEDTKSLIDDMDLDPEIKSDIKLSLGLNEDGLMDEYESLLNRLTETHKNKIASGNVIGLSEKEAKKFLDGLSAEELSIATEILPEIDVNATVEEIQSMIDREMIIQGLTFDLNIEAEVAGVEALNTALAESVSATGLSSESITALKGRYAELESQGYDLSSMFEETSHGVRINRQEFDKLEKAYSTQKLAKIDSDLAQMKKTYDELGEELKTCGDEAKAGLYNDRLDLAKKISEAATLASQYEGLTSAYNDWISAEEAGQERDMYENVIKGFETVDDEISRGWFDDSAIEFLSLLTGRTDLAGKSGKDLKKIYDDLDNTIKDTSYSVRDFFTVDKDGNSTSKGVYNFLDAIGQLEEEKFGGKDVVKRDKDGNVIGFDFELVAERDKDGNIIKNSDQVIAEALGISEELVQIMVRASDDAGFVISMDGTYKQLADLQNEARTSADYLKDIGLTEFEFDFNTTDVENLNKQLNEAHKILDNPEFWNTDGTFNFTAKGATEAMQVVSTLQAKIDNLTGEKYGIGLTVEDDEFKEPLENLQEYGRKIAALNQLELNPKANAKEIEEIKKELDELAKEFNELPEEKKIELGIVGEEGKALTEEYFDNLPDEKKIELGFVDEDGKPLTNVEDAIQKKIETDGLTIPTVLDIQANMDKNIEKLVGLGMLNSGEYTDEEKEVIKKQYDLEIEVDEVDDSDVDNKVDKATSGKAKGISREANIKVVADVLGTENVEYLSAKLKGLDDKTIKAIADVIGSGDVEDLKNVINGLNDKQVQAVAEALGYKDVNELNTAIEGMDGNVVQAVAEALGLNDVINLQNTVDGMHGNEVDAKVNTDGQASKVGTLQSAIDGLKGKTVDVVVNTFKNVFETITSGGSKRKVVDGTANADGASFATGTTGIAFKQGNWRTKNTVSALTGELGRELVVTRDNKWYTVGDSGAEFSTIPKGSIVFNHKQTEELFKNGKVTSGGGRGKALSSGTAFASGTAFSSGTGGGLGNVTVKADKVTVDSKDSSSSSSSEKKSYNAGTRSSGSNKSSSTKSSSSSSSSSKEEEKFEESVDWIEIAISRIQRAIDILDKKASNIYKKWSTRNNVLTKEISKVNDEIALQQKAYDEYMSEASKVGLSSDYAEKVRNGTIDIQTITDESLKEKIDDYKNFYEKALACKDAIEELKETEASLYKQRFDNVSTQYDGILGIIEHEKSILEEYISQTEANAMLVSANYYKALVSNEKDNVAQLKKEKSSMLSELENAMKSGTIDKYSEAWYDMISAIDEVTLSITQSETAIKEYQQTIQQLSWETFDLLQEKISSITEETDFLIDLMSNDKLFEDNGQLTNEGKSTMGLHGVSYNVNMAQADKYAKEAKRLKKELAKDPFDTELEKRYCEMISLQQEHILSAEDEKEAIRDLVEEGIEKELDALQELIDKKNEALDSEREFYEYQNKVKEQTKEIASLEKQISSYSGDDSEEAKSKVQQLKVDLENAKADLEETEYDKWISDTSSMLDSLYLEYEEILNMRLDNIDALISDMITEINNDSTIIGNAIRETADSVGYTLSDSMNVIWDTNSTKINSVITTYGDRFSSAQTTTNNALSTINSNLQNMINQLNAIAKTNTKSASTSSATNSKPANTTKPAPTPSTPSSTNTSKTISVGGKINASGAPIYDHAGDNTPERQLYRNDPIYKVLKTNGNWIQVRWHKLSSGITGWFKKGDVKAYATGKKNLLNDEVAWTQEKGREFIVRPSDGAILTPVAKGDSVLNANASNNIWDMANAPSDFIKENLNLGNADIPNSSNINNTYTQHFENTLNFPNVKSYEEMLVALSKDPNFKRLINAMGVDQLAGKSSLAVKKAIR